MSDIWDSARPRGAYRELSASLLTMTPAVRIIDVREPDEFVGEFGHIPGAELIPMGQLPGAADGWDRDELLLLVCRSGNRSGQVASALAARGFSKLVNLAGGMMLYRTTGLPIERGPEERPI